MGLTRAEIEQNLHSSLHEAIHSVAEPWGELTVEATAEAVNRVCKHLHGDPDLALDQLIDLCGVDYLEYKGHQAETPRFAVVYHLLSVRHNHRLRLRTWLPEERPVLPSVIDIWNAANWFEREAFDMFGIIFEGHPDLRRILTDYGFTGHPFRKDFPLVGHVEMRYDPDLHRVVYQPVTIEERNLVPRTHLGEFRHNSGT